ncbi:MAG: MFS transporter [Caulobacteraceae bacterium]|nr:MFS transporter [Caulobacteraceae bacterium]
MLAATIGSASAMRTVFSPVQEAAASSLHINDFQMSLLQGLALSLPIAALAIPVGRITDRGNRAVLLFFLALLWTIGTALSVFGTEFWHIFLARMLAGIGAFSSLTVTISMVADLSTPDTRGRSLMFLSLGNLVGRRRGFRVRWFFARLFHARRAADYWTRTVAERAACFLGRQLGAHVALAHHSRTRPPGDYRSEPRSVGCTA